VCQVHTFLSNTALGGGAGSLSALEGVDSAPLMHRLLKVEAAAIAAAKEASAVKEEVEDDSVLEATNEVRGWVLPPPPFCFRIFRSRC
jgi:hypothetical protein